MERDEIIAKVKQGNYNQNQLLGWLQALPTSTEKRKPSEYKVGDVLMHSVFKHPMILLKKQKEDWLCGLMTSDENCPEKLEECRSRFFEGKYITKTLFTTSEIKGSFVNTYEKNKQLRDILIKLKKLLAQ